MCAAPARAPLEIVRRLYDAWNAGDVAGAATRLSPQVRWESFGAAGAATGPQGMQQTLAGGSGGTWQLSPVSIDLLVGIGHHVIAFSRRTGAPGAGEAERLEVWTVHDDRAVHYRGYPLDEGLAVLAATTASQKVDALSRAVLAFNRRDHAGWLAFFEPDARAFAEQLGGQRLDDVQILGESPDALVISAVHSRDDARRALHLVVSFANDRARRVVAHGAPEAALSAAAAG